MGTPNSRAALPPSRLHLTSCPVLSIWTCFLVFLLLSPSCRSSSLAMLIQWARLLQSHWHFVSLWTVACKALLSMGFSRQEYWSGLPHPPLEDLPNPGIESTSPVFPACRRVLYLWASGEAHCFNTLLLFTLYQPSATFLAPETGFMEDSFSVDGEWGWVGMEAGSRARFGDDSSALHVLCTLFIMSASPQTIRYWILEAGDPCPILFPSFRRVMLPDFSFQSVNLQWHYSLAWNSSEASLRRVRTPR